jgi:hypothetical protein
MRAIVSSSDSSRRLWVPIPRAFTLLVLFAVIFCDVLTAQTSPTTTITARDQQQSYAHRGAIHLKVSASQAASAPVAPPAPELPHWPANEKPVAASVLWDSHGLHIEAQNSSLQQILHDVTAATGAKVEGMGIDERVFGSYGPGQVSDVLSQLLEGSAYNVLLIGNQGNGTPRQVVLSTRSSVSAPGAIKSAPANAKKEDTDDDDEPSPPDVNPGAAVQPHSPQQILQEMQQRRQARQPTPPQN